MAKNIYAVVEGAKIPVVKGQAKLVLDAIRDINRPFAIEELVPVIRPKLASVQTPTRIAAYYTCVFHKADYLKVVGKMNEDNVKVMSETAPAAEPVAATPTIILTDNWRN